MDENIRVLDIVIPPEADIKLPDPELVNYYKEYDNRNIFIDYDIDENLFDVTKQILEYNRLDKLNKVPINKRREIKLFINSFGGDLYQAYSLIATILASKTKVVCINMGVCMSAGLLILLAGHERYAMRFSTAMIHQGSGAAQGSYSEMEEQQKNYRKLIDTMKDYILDRTKIEPALFARKKSKDWYICDTEQVELGIVSGIIENLDDIL